MYILFNSLQIPTLYMLSSSLSLFFRGVVFRLQTYICYTKRHIGTSIQTLKEKGFNFELYKFSYLLLTYLLLTTAMY